jgi:hypothetical protein
MEKTINASEVISEARPTIKSSTVRQYEVQLEQLKKMFKTDNYKFLNDFDAVVEKLQDKHFTTQRNFYNSIIVLLLALDENKELIDKYSKLRDELNVEYKKSNKGNKISEKQAPNFATMDEIDGMLKDMETEIKKRRLKSKGDLTGKEKELYMMYVVYQMLKHIPTRNDIAGMVITTPINYPKQPKDKNYLVVGRDIMYYMLNDYKSDKTYGKDKKLIVPVSLSRILRPFIRATGKKSGDVLLTSSTGNAISRNVLSQMLLRTSKKYMGKGVSTTMLRKSVVSHELGEAKKKEQELADKMQHSVETQSAIYNKEH